MINRLKEILQAEAFAITNIPVDDSVLIAVQTILQCSGKVFTSGLGKAGYIAQKAASTFCTTGTPAVFLHPADASHGDVGGVSSGDVLLAFSNSGKTREVLETVHFCRRLGLSSVISITASEQSPLGEESDIVLQIGEIKEACALGFTPTASTAAMTALSDGLALLAMEQRGFTKQDFALRHHGGYLGQQSRE